MRRNDDDDDENFCRLLETPKDDEGRDVVLPAYYIRALGELLNDDPRRRLGVAAAYRYLWGNHTTGNLMDP